MIWLIAATGFLVRAAPRHFLRNAIVSDTYFHLFCAAEIRSSRFKIPRTFDRALIPHEYTYPYFYHFFLALFPTPARHWVERLNGAVFDTINTTTIYYFTLWALRHQGFPNAGAAAVWTAAIYTFHPALLRIGGGTRAYNGSTRVPGQTFYFIHIMGALYGFVSNNPYALAASLTAGALIPITAKFGTQALMFFGVFFTVFVSPLYALFLAAVFALLFLISGGRMIRVLKGHVRHSEYYVKHIQAVFVWPNIISVRQYLLYAKCNGLITMARSLKHRSSELFISALEWFYCEQHWLHLLLTVFPLSILTFIICCRDFTAIHIIDASMFIWASAGLACFFLTKTRRLMFLGEGERYLEYSLPPAVFLTVKILYPEGVIILDGILLYSFFSTAVFLFLYFRKFSTLHRDWDGTAAIFDRINKMKDAVIWPIGPFHFQALYRTTTAKVLTHAANLDMTIMPLDDFKLLMGNYPFPSEKYGEIIARYGITHIVSDGTQLNHYAENITGNSKLFFSHLELVEELPTLVMYKVREAKNTEPIFRRPR